MADALLLLEGSRFWLCDGRGDAVGGTQGLFDSDVRHLSAWRLRLNGEPLHLLSSQNLTLSTARIFGTISGAYVEHNPSITVMREQRVEDALKEKIVLENHSASTRQIKLTLEFEADFKDIFEMKRDAFDGERPNLPSNAHLRLRNLARARGWLAEVERRLVRLPSFERKRWSNGVRCRAPTQDALGAIDSRVEPWQRAR